MTGHHRASRNLKTIILKAEGRASRRHTHKNTRPAGTRHPKPVFLAPGDPGSFNDFPPAAQPWNPRQVLCHVCQGYGGWNLQLNTGALATDPEQNTPERRHKFAHHMTRCHHCDGFGLLLIGSKDDSCERHDWRYQWPSRGGNLYKCALCSKLSEIGPGVVRLTRSYPELDQFLYLK